MPACAASIGLTFEDSGRNLVLTIRCSAATRRSDKALAGSLPSRPTEWNPQTKNIPRASPHISLHNLCTVPADFQKPTGIPFQASRVRLLCWLIRRDGSMGWTCSSIRDVPSSFERSSAIERLHVWKLLNTRESNFVGAYSSVVEWLLATDDSEV